MSKNSAYIKTDVEGLVKDPSSGAILNVDNLKLEAYRKQKMILENSKTSAQRIEKVERDLLEIKNLLKQLITKNT